MASALLLASSASALMFGLSVPTGTAVRATMAASWDRDQSAAWDFRHGNGRHTPVALGGTEGWVSKGARVASDPYANVIPAEPPAAEPPAATTASRPSTAAPATPAAAGKVVIGGRPRTADNELAWDFRHGVGRQEPIPLGGMEAWASKGQEPIQGGAISPSGRKRSAANARSTTDTDAARSATVPSEPASGEPATTETSTAGAATARVAASRKGNEAAWAFRHGRGRVRPVPLGGPGAW